MTVFVVTIDYDYEGSELIDVFADPAPARGAAEGLLVNAGYGSTMGEWREVRNSDGRLTYFLHFGVGYAVVREMTVKQ